MRFFPPTNDEVPGVGFLRVADAEFGEEQGVTAVLINGEGGLEIEVAGVKSEDTQKATGAGKVAEDHALKIRH